MSTGIGAAPMASPRTRPATGRKASTAAPALEPANRASSCRADRAVVSMSRCTASKTSAKGMPCRADNAHDVASRPNMRSTCSIPGPQAARTSGSAVGTPLNRADAASPRSRSANGRGASLATFSTAVTGWAPARSSVTTPRSSDARSPQTATVVRARTRALRCNTTAATSSPHPTVAPIPTVRTQPTVTHTAKAVRKRRWGPVDRAISPSSGCPLGNTVGRRSRASRCPAARDGHSSKPIADTVIAAISTTPPRRLVFGCPVVKAAPG